MNHRIWPVLFAVVIASFLLPWIGVSCQGQTVLTATGVQLLTSDMQTPMLEGLSAFGVNAADMASDAAADRVAVPARWRLAALVVLVSAVAGLVLTLVRRAIVERVSLALAAVQSIVLGVGLALAPSDVRSGLRQAGAEDAVSNPFTGLGQTMTDLVTRGFELEFGIGFYAALAASIALVGLGLYALGRRPTPVVVPEPEEA